MQDSVKAQHILPFFPNFILLAQRLEDHLLAGTEADSSGARDMAVPRMGQGSSLDGHISHALS
jgi:hypothetical protein